MEFKRIDHEQRLYTIPCGAGGYSCLGFEVAERRRVGVWNWIGKPVAEIALGTEEHFSDYMFAMDEGRRHAARFKSTCAIELTPQLHGLEGRRVEVIDADARGGKRRFIVGRSTGWMPCHLEIKTARSKGGGPAAKHYPGLKLVK